MSCDPHSITFWLVTGGYSALEYYLGKKKVGSVLGLVFTSILVVIGAVLILKESKWRFKK